MGTLIDDLTRTEIEAAWLAVLINKELLALGGAPQIGPASAFADPHSTTYPQGGQGGRTGIPEDPWLPCADAPAPGVKTATGKTGDRLASRFPPAA